jgi:hypothetical protein
LTERRLRTIHVGLGAIGAATVREAVAAGLQPVAGVDIDPALSGRDLAVVTNGKPIGAQVFSTLDDLPAADVAIVCTGSRLASVTPLLISLARQGLDVVSTCEELAHPWRQNPDQAREIDQVAKDSAVTIVGTGINPGFVLDTLIVALARATNRIEHVFARRRVDLATRRAQLREKAGVGLKPAAFHANAANLGHVGLQESLDMLLAGLAFDDVATSFTMEPVIAEVATSVDGWTVEQGRCVGMRQLAGAHRGGREVVRLELEMALGLESPADEIRIKGAPPIDIQIDRGIAGDDATAAIVVSASKVVGAASPGLHSMAELPIAVLDHA